MLIGNVEYFPEKDILMLFAEQPENDPYKYFLDGLFINDLTSMPFKSVYCFHSKKDFLEVFRNKANCRNGDHPDSMWYWVLYEGRCICSGACDPDDIEGFAESFNLSDEELDEYYEVLDKEEDQENAAIADYVDTLIRNLDRERDEFMAGYAKKDPIAVYKDYGVIGFYEEFYQMMQGNFLFEMDLPSNVWKWLSELNKPLHFLHDQYVDSDAIIAHNWDAMFDFIESTYRDANKK